MPIGSQVNDIPIISAESFLKLPLQALQNDENAYLLAFCE